MFVHGDGSPRALLIGSHADSRIPKPDAPRCSESHNKVKEYSIRQCYLHLLPDIQQSKLAHQLAGASAHYLSSKQSELFCLALLLPTTNVRKYECHKGSLCIVCRRYWIFLLGVVIPPSARWSTIGFFFHNIVSHQICNLPHTSPGTGSKLND